MIVTFELNRVFIDMHSFCVLVVTWYHMVGFQNGIKKTFCVACRTLQARDFSTKSTWLNNLVYLCAPKPQNVPEFHPNIYRFSMSLKSI